MRNDADPDDEFSARCESGKELCLQELLAQKHSVTAQTPRIEAKLKPITDSDNKAGDSDAYC